MKKSIINLAALLVFPFVGAITGYAEESAGYPVTAQSDATVLLTEDDGSDGEGDSGSIYGPGGGEDGELGGEIQKPGGGESGENGVVDPQQTTPLRFSLLSAFNFGTIKISGNTEKYTAQVTTPNFIEGGLEERPNFVQVTDNRGSNAGWHLTAKIAQQFTNGDSVLDGSTIALNNGWTEPIKEDLIDFAPEVASNVVLTTSADALIVSAAKDKGMGTWNVMYGTLYEPEQPLKGDARESVILEIPGSVKKVAGEYRAKILWTLNSTPAA